MPAEQLRRVAESVLQELKLYGHEAPFICYVNAASDDGLEHVFIFRGDQPLPRVPSSENVQYVRYRLPLGRIAEHKPGGTPFVLRIPQAVGRRTFSSHVFETTFTLLAKDEFTVRAIDGGVDAFDNRITLPSGAHFIPALSEWLKGTSTSLRASSTELRRRPIVNKFELADLEIVDEAQGNVWRQSIRKFIAITGAPGTGKTTTLIKRLAQKVDADALKANGEAAAVDIVELRKSLEGHNGWILFTPSELLRKYLQEALVQEGLKATDNRVPVWDHSKVIIARDVLRLIGKDRTFSLSTTPLIIRDSNQLSRWTIAFRDYFETKTHTDLHSCIAKAQSELVGAVAALKKIPEDAISGAQKAALKLWDEAQSFARIAPGTRLPRSLRALLLLNRRTLDFTEVHPENTWNSIEQVHIAALLAAVGCITKEFTDESSNSLDAILKRIPADYREFRTSERTIYLPESFSAVKANRLDALELDTMIYVALSIVRDAFDLDDLKYRRGNGLTQRLINEFVHVVAVDEATDFSAVELACMRLLAHPLLDSATFSGDPMQRMTNQGIADWADIQGLVEPPETHELNFSYRQSRKLLPIAAKLFEQTMRKSASFQSGIPDGPLDPEALHYRSKSPDDESEWLISRIYEIYKLSEDELPSIALLVPTDEVVDEIAGRIRSPLLERYGIETEACRRGQVLGTTAKVRVFSVEFIKGLEFEAVFFVRVDQMAQDDPALLSRFLYVGLTRARSYLGLTTSGGFPTTLEHVMDCFKSSSWIKE